EDGVALYVSEHGIAVIVPLTHGWGHFILEELGDVFRKTGAQQPTTSGYETQEEALCGAAFHLAQNVWTPRIKDDEAFVRSIFQPKVPELNGEIGRAKADGLRRWIAFQRDYKRLVDA